MNRKTKLISKIVTAVLVLSILIGCLANADTLPYVTYNFDYWKDIVYTPAAYVPNGSITSDSLGLDHVIGDVPDLYVDDNLGIIVISDNTNSCIYILDASDYSLITEINSFFNSSTGKNDGFNGPTGVYVSNVSAIADDGLEADSTHQLYVCDPGNERLLWFDIDYDKAGREINVSYAGKLIMDDIESDIINKEKGFHPQKVCVDSANRIYVINQFEFQGILQLEQDGTFNGYFGTISVNISVWQKFWKTISTSAQRSKSTLYIPTEYTGIDIDDSGFLLACYKDQTGVQAVMRLNSKGQDVIRKGANENLSGDIMKVKSTANKYSGFNYIKDVAFNEKGMYSMLDNLRGRIFTYDQEGNLLYIYGGLGTQEGTFSSAQAIDVNGKDRLVSDVNKSEITIFRPTEYGELINEAVSYRYDGDEAKAVATWQKVLMLNENFEQAYIGIGKAYLNSGEYKKAMDYLSLGMSRSYYSIAYKRYRNNVLKAHFNVIFGVILVLLVAFIVTRIRKKYKNNKYSDD